MLIGSGGLSHDPPVPSLANADARYFKGEVPFWNEVLKHDTYDEFWVHGGQWGAHRKGAGDDVLTGATPDELNRAIRADWARRAAL